MNLFSLAKAFPTEDAALEYWIQTRWPDGVRCLACGQGKIYRIETRGKTGKSCLLFECADCGLHFSPTTNTLFHDSHLPMQKWFATIALMVESKKGISASQVSRHIGVTYKTAWYLCHRIREAMQEDKAMTLGGESTTVEIDETYVGGRKLRQGRKAGKNAKTVVLGIAEREGRIHLQKLDNAQGQSIRPVLDTKLSVETKTVITDGNKLYRSLIPKEKHVEAVHKREIYQQGYTSTQTVENAFSLFKRGIVGNYHKLSADHLGRYNRRHLQPQLFDMALQNLANKKPLPYKKLTFEDF